MLERVKVSNYLTRQRLRQLLEVMIPWLDAYRQLDYISYFLSSSYIYEQLSAIELAEKVWNEEIQQVLLDAYKNAQNHRILSVIILHTDAQHAIELIKEQWIVGIPKALIVKFMSRLKGRTVEELDFLTSVDPANYIALLRHSKGNIDDKTLQECYYRIPKKSRPFALWNLGHLGKWDLIEGETGNFLSNPSDAFLGFSDNLFEK